MLRLYFINRAIKQRNMFLLILLMLVWLFYSNEKSFKSSNHSNYEKIPVISFKYFKDIETCDENPKTLKGELIIKKNPINFGAFFKNMTKDDFIFLKNIENGKHYL